MANSKLTDLSAPVSLATSDILYVVTNPGSSPTSQKATIAQVQTAMGLAAIATSGSASDLSTGTIPSGRLPASLSSIYPLTPAADTIPYYTGASSGATATFTSYGRSLVADVDAASARSTLGLGSLATKSTVGTSDITNAAVTYAKIQNESASTLLGNPTGLAAAPAEISIGSEFAFNTTTLNIASNGITNAMLRQGGATSVIGRSANSTGNVADIAASNDGDVLRRSGTTLGFGTLASASIASGAVTYAKIQNESASTLLGNPTGLAAAPSEISIGTEFAFNTTTLNIATNGITNAMFRQSSGLSVVGRSANTTGNVADITGTDGQVLRVSGTTLGFGTVATAGITDAAVTYAKIQNVTSNRLLGRSTAGAGVVEEISIGSGLSLSGGTLSATGSGASPLTTKGDIWVYSSVDTRLPVGTDQFGLISDSTQTPGLRWQAQDFPNCRYGYNFRDDFLSAVVSTVLAGNLSWTYTISGTSAAASSLSAPNNNRPGVLHFVSGTTSTGRVAIDQGITNMFFGGGKAIIQFGFRVPTLPNGTDDFNIYLGMHDGNSSTAPTDGAFFFIDQSITGAYSSLRGRTSAAGVTSDTSADQTIVANTWYDAKIVVAADGSAVSFYINDVQVGANVTTNIPTSSSNVFAPACFTARKKLGTTNTAMLDLDYVEFWQEFTSSR